MSTIAGALRKAVGRSPDVTERVEGLSQAVAAARGRLDDALLDEADAVVERVGERLRLSSEHTVVAIAGATGSGKSSLFNALTGLDLAAVGVRRPTTSWVLACSWGAEGATELLDWLEIPRRHQLSRTGVLDQWTVDRDLQGLVLLDLPDHDSTEASHQLEVDRLVRVVDVLLWVLDPQKYADAAVHDRYLRPLQSHAEVMMVTLNHIDELPPDTRDAALADVRRLLESDGLGRIPLFATSATRGTGLDDVRRELSRRVSEKRLAKQRLSADVKAVAERIAERTGSAPPAELGSAVRTELVDACADAAGVPVVVSAVETSTLRNAKSATGWPVTSWLAKIRPDPMRKLNLVRPTDSSRTASSAASPRTTVPGSNSVQRARVATSVRAVADVVTAPMAPPWEYAVRHASVARLDEVAVALDRAVATTDLDLGRTPRWWSAVRLLQWLFLAVAAVGGLWLLALAGLAFLQSPWTIDSQVNGLPIPTMLLVGGVLLGLLLALLSRALVGSSARRRAARADARLRTQVAAVADDLVLAPMRAEIDAYVRCRNGLAAALER